MNFGVVFGGIITKSHFVKDVLESRNPQIVRKQSAIGKDGRDYGLDFQNLRCRIANTERVFDFFKRYIKFINFNFHQIY